jgi:hypothetical protein
MSKKSVNLVYECWHCSHRSYFFEDEITQALAKSYETKVYLSDKALDEHTLVFYKGVAVVMCSGE